MKYCLFHLTRKITNIDVWCGMCVHFTVYQPNKKYKKAGHIQRKYDCCELSRLYHIGMGYWCIVKLNLKAMINHRVGKSILNPNRLSLHCWYYSNIIQWFCCSFSLYLGTLKKVPKKNQKMTYSKLIPNSISEWLLDSF
jgi:hypothetical protein